MFLIVQLIHLQTSPNGLRFLKPFLMKIFGFMVKTSFSFNQRFNWSFLGTSTSNFTAINQLFLSNPQIILWRFEVVYTFVSDTSSSSLHFVINQPPSNGSCSISPLNGTTSTLFTISCPDWFDADGIEDYSLYGMFIFSANQNIIVFCLISLDKWSITANDCCFFRSVNISSSITSWRWSNIITLFNYQYSRYIRLYYRI